MATSNDWDAGPPSTVRVHDEAFEDGSTCPHIPDEKELVDMVEKARRHSVPVREFVGECFAAEEEAAFEG